MGVNYILIFFLVVSNYNQTFLTYILLTLPITYGFNYEWWRLCVVFWSNPCLSLPNYTPSIVLLTLNNVCYFCLKVTSHSISGLSLVYVFFFCCCCIIRFTFKAYPNSVRIWVDRYLVYLGLCNPSCLGMFLKFISQYIYQCHLCWNY